MTVRVYVPSTLTGLQLLQRDGQIFPLGGTVFGVTAALREAYTSGDDEELAEAAMRHAARASLRLLAVDDDPQAAEPTASDAAPAAPNPVRRVVITVDVPAATERPDLDDPVLKISEPIALDQVVAVHVDVSDAEEAVIRAAQVVDAADLGDEDSELIVGDAEDHDLAWYATQELPFLLELL